MQYSLFTWWLKATEILCISSWERCGIHSYSGVHTIDSGKCGANPCIKTLRLVSLREHKVFSRFSSEHRKAFIPDSRSRFRSPFMNTTNDSSPVMNWSRSADGYKLGRTNKGEWDPVFWGETEFQQGQKTCLRKKVSKGKRLIGGDETN